MTTNNVLLPTESMIVAGFEAVSMFHDTDAYKQMTGCQGSAESARICWAAMVAAMPAGETPRQDVAPSDAAILSARSEAAWARYGDEADIKFGRTLLSRFGQAAMPASAARDLLAERRRQLEAEGWTPEHDDAHTNCSMALAAACYALDAAGYSTHHLPFWPWDWSWWKPGGPRRNLVKAGALLLAEIERIDRAGRRIEGE